MDVDPLASMRCWAVEVELGGRTYDVPALPAVDWWPIVAGLNPLDVLDIVRSDELEERLLTGELDHADLIDPLREVIEEASGRSYHATVILVMVAQSQWPVINGQMVQRGFRWEDQPLGAVLDAIYAVVTGVLSKEEREKFLALLDNEALTSGKPTTRQRKKLTSEFEAMAGPMPTTGVKASAGQSGSGRPKTQPRLQRPRPAGRSGAPRQQPGPRAGSDPVATT